MKKTKQNTISEPIYIVIDQETERKKRFIIYNCSEINSITRSRVYLIKNYYSHKIDFNVKVDLMLIRCIMRRNTKYMRGIKPYITKFHPSLDQLKQLKPLHDINLIWNF